MLIGQPKIMEAAATNQTKILKVDLVSSAPEASLTVVEASSAPIAQTILPSVPAQIAATAQPESTIVNSKRKT